MRLAALALLLVACSSKGGPTRWHCIDERCYLSAEECGRVEDLAVRYGMLDSHCSRRASATCYDVLYGREWLHMCFVSQAECARSFDEDAAKGYAPSELRPCRRE